MLSHIGSSSSSKLVINLRGRGIGRPAFKQTDPPCRRVERSLAVVQGRVEVVEEVPYYFFPPSRQLSCPRQARRKQRGRGEETKRNALCPTMTPQISSFGTVPCNTKLNPINTHGNHGAVKTNSPRNDRRVSGLRRPQIYTNVLLRPEPRKGMPSSGDNKRRWVLAYRRSQAKGAGLRPADSSSRRE